MPESLARPDPAGIPDDPPPVLGTWARVYALVLVYLAALIFLFWGFTKYYRPQP